MLVVYLFGFSGILVARHFLYRPTAGASKSVSRLRDLQVLRGTTAEALKRALYFWVRSHDRPLHEGGDCHFFAAASGRLSSFAQPFVYPGSTF